MEKPIVLLISAPSACGKDTVIRNMIATSSYDIAKIVTTTTRAPRENGGVLETNGKEHYFLTTEQFGAGIAAGEFLEHAICHTNYYGSTWKELESKTGEGKISVFDVDVQGVPVISQILKERFTPISVFLLPPSMEELERRMRGRGDNNEDTIRIRLARAHEEIQLSSGYDFSLINVDSQKTAENILQIIDLVGGGKSFGETKISLNLV